MQPPMPPLDDESPTMPSLSGLPSLRNLPSHRGAHDRPTVPPMPGQPPTSMPDRANVVVGMGIGIGAESGEPGPIGPITAGAVPNARLRSNSTRPIQDQPKRSRKGLLALLALALLLLVGLAVLVESVLPGYTSELSGSLALPGSATASNTSNTDSTPLATSDGSTPDAAGTVPVVGTLTPGTGTPATTATTGTPVDATATAGSGGPAATATTVGAPVPTATDAPPAPHLSVSPLVSTGNCVLGTWPKLTVRNDGGGSLSWSATTSDKTFVHATPSSSTLGAGASVTVSLSGILHLGNHLTVSFSSNGGPATVTINCA